VLKDKCLFYIFIKLKLGKCGIKVWVAADAKSFHAYKMPLYIGRTDGAREKKQGLRDPKNMSVTYTEPEEVLSLIISLQAVN